LWYFSLAYSAGLYGFPLIASLVITLSGYPALIAVLLVIGVGELAVSVWTPDPAGRIRAIRPPARAKVIAGQGVGPATVRQQRVAAGPPHVER
jgi:hypothetical protein